MERKETKLSSLLYSKLSKVQACLLYNLTENYNTREKITKNFSLLTSMCEPLD